MFGAFHGVFQYPMSTHVPCQLPKMASLRPTTKKLHMLSSRQEAVSLSNTVQERDEVAPIGFN